MGVIRKSIPLVILIGIVAMGCFFVILDSANARQTSFFNFSSFGGVDDISSPSNHIEESQIHVYKDRIVIDIDDAQWAKFTDTNSMDPVLDKEANSIELKPESPNDVSIGDIISYRSDYTDGLVVHRIIEKEEDEEGIYFTAKGDNNPSEDPGKIRFDQIEGVLVAVIY